MRLPFSSRAPCFFIILLKSTAPLAPSDAGRWKNRLKAQRSGFETERKKEGAKCSFPGSYANRGNEMKRVSSDAGSCQRS